MVYVVREREEEGGDGLVERRWRSDVAVERCSAGWVLRRCDLERKTRRRSDGGRFVLWWSSLVEDEQ